MAVSMEALKKILGRAGGESKNILEQLIKSGKWTAQDLMRAGKTGSMANLGSDMALTGKQLGKSIMANKLGAGALAGGAGALGAGAYGASELMGDDEDEGLEAILSQMKNRR
jgi:hypothetical protein